MLPTCNCASTAWINWPTEVARSPPSDLSPVEVIPMISVV